jgi:hypothetical protein
MDEFTKLEKHLTALDNERQRATEELRQEVLRSEANRSSSRLVRYKSQQEIARSEQLMEDAEKLCPSDD